LVVGGLWIVFTPNLVLNVEIFDWYNEKVHAIISIGT